MRHLQAGVGTHLEHLLENGVEKSPLGSVLRRSFHRVGGQFIFSVISHEGRRAAAAGGGGWVRGGGGGGVDGGRDKVNGGGGGVNGL